MITIDLMGGLGNQLFQWALGRAFQLCEGQAVQHNTTRLETDRGRKYLLDSLGIGAYLTRERPGRQEYEGSLRYRSDIRNLRGDVSLCGYWQCETYFQDVAAIIRGEAFSNDFYTSEKTNELAAQIGGYGDRSCFLHVRRSDNLSPRAVMYHGLTCAVENTYYENAKAILRTKVPGVHFFVFSDDPDWVRANMTESDMTVVGHNPGSFTTDDQGILTKNDHGRECEDMWLMSLCRHAIMANSTFSWWATWLNSKQDGVVTAPDPWFATKDADSSDILPTRWTKVSMR